MTTPNEELRARRAAIATPTPQAGEVSAATAGGEYVLVPMEPTPEMVREGIYNTNRKYNHNPVDEVIVLQVWSSMVGSRPVECIALEAHTTPTPSSPVVAQGDDFVSDGDALMRVYDGLMAEWEGLGRSRTEGSHSADVYEWAQTIYYAARRRRITPQAAGDDVTHERDLLANAIRDAAVKAGIVDPGAPLTGPHLLMLCDNLATAGQQAAGVSVSEEIGRLAMQLDSAASIGDERHLRVTVANVSEKLLALQSTAAGAAPEGWQQSMRAGPPPEPVSHPNQAWCDAYADWYEAATPNPGAQHGQEGQP